MPSDPLESLGPALAAAAREALGPGAADLARENPWMLAERVEGIGFATADELAARLGLPEDSPQRVRAAILHVLEQGAEDGHVYLPFHRLAQDAQALLQVDRRLIPPLIEALAAGGSLVVEEPEEGQQRDRCVYLAGLHRAEVGVAEGVRRLLAAAAPERPAPNLAAAPGPALTQRQAEAVRTALSRRIAVITGGPGTGKTTVLRALLSVASGLRVALAAPTGRAARRMSEATGREAATLHRLLEYAPREGFRRNASAPLDCDLVVVDEASMVDVGLMRHLLAALPPGASLLLVGDRHQLPSVGPGRVLADIIESGRVPTVELSEIFRQAEGSDLITATHRILLGAVPEAAGSLAESSFVFLERDDPAAAAGAIVELASERIPRLLALDPREATQVLAPMNRGEAGVERLNALLQAALNPQGAALGARGRGLRVGDRVMQTRNNYDKRVFNGDVGRIVEAAADRLVVAFEADRVVYRRGEVSQLALAYAVSVHKAQGSEYPAVVIALLEEHSLMLERTLLYTAVSRARRLAVVVGSRRALRRAVSHTGGLRRFTRLSERLLAVGGEASRGGAPGLS